MKSPSHLPFVLGGCIMILVVLCYYNSNYNKTTTETGLPFTSSLSVYTDMQTKEFIKREQDDSTSSTNKQSTSLFSTSSHQKIPPTTLSITTAIQTDKVTLTSLTPLHGAPTKKVDHKIYRYVLCSSYWEQQTAAIINMFGLQRWGNSVGLTVVEPFVHMSQLKFSNDVLQNDGISNALRLGDYIDIKYYNEQSEKYGVPALENWEDFTRVSTKKIIVVIISYNHGTGGTFVGKEIDNHAPCLEQKKLFFDGHSKLFHMLQFEVVRTVCISFSRYIIPPEKFAAPLQIGNQKESVTVWLSEWQGVENGRVSFTGLGHNKFGRINVPGGANSLLSMIHPSKRLIFDSKKYLNQIIGSDFDQYKAVVIRTKGRQDPESDVKFFNGCADQLDQYLKSLPSSSRNKIFLAIDMGKFGDMTSVNRLNYDNSKKIYTGNGKKFFQKVLNIVYGNKSIESYENDFIQATNGITDSGYIGAVQKNYFHKCKESCCHWWTLILPKRNSVKHAAPSQ